MLSFYGYVQVVINAYRVATSRGRSSPEVCTIEHWNSAGASNALPPEVHRSVRICGGFGLIESQRH
jgi:hypothetical protein